MDGNMRKAKAEEDEVLKIVKLRTIAPPAHYTLKIESLSKLADVLQKTKSDKYESAVFEAGGYKWKLLVYPTGNQKGNGKDHISLYLAMDKTNGLSLGWAVHVVFKFFVYDWIRREYLMFQDGKVRLYHSFELEHGFDQILPQGMFCDPSNGFLVGDCCMFGAEVYVVKGSGQGEKLLILDNPEDGTFTWEIEKFSTLGEESLDSEEFTVGPCTWKLVLYPRGYRQAGGKSLSLYLQLADNNYGRQPKVCLECKLSIEGQVQVQGQRRQEKTVNNRWFDSKNLTWGFRNFLMLRDLHNYLVKKDTLVVEAEISRISVVQSMEFDSHS